MTRQEGAPVGREPLGRREASPAHEPRRPTLPWRAQPRPGRPSLARFLRPAAATWTQPELSHTELDRPGRPGPAAGRRDAAAAATAAAPPPASAAELRELAEIGDLVGELAGLVQDLGSLVVGLMTAAAGGGAGAVRTFAVPPELTDLALAYQDLRKEQRVLSLRFDASAAGSDRSALRGSLAALTERATRAVAAAAAVSFPAARPPGAGPGGGTAGRPGADDPAANPAGPGDGAGTDNQPGTGAGPETDEQAEAAGPQDRPASAGTRRWPGPEPAAREAVAPREPASPQREGTGVQTTPLTGTTPGGTGESARRTDTGTRDKLRAPVAIALDAPDIDVAAHWATLVTPYVSTVKIGLELYLRYGPNVVATVRGGSGVRVFLDLKLHDIPNTVAGAARAVAKLRPEILTVHAAGGADMIKAAVEAAPDTLVAGVTLLTSMTEGDLADIGVGGSVSDAVRRMAALAVAAGARGLVCSPQEVAAVRAEVGDDIMLITPGIRPAGATSDDQARIATPEEALKAGADLLVIGRPVTRSPDPGAAAAALAAALRRVAPTR